MLIGATWGMNALAGGNIAGKVADKVLSSANTVGSETYKCVQTLQSFIIPQASKLTQNILKVLPAIMSPLTETIEELYVDPFIEALVTNAVADAGGSEIDQILLSGLAESGRETFLSTVSKFARAFSSMSIDTQISTNLENMAQQNREQIGLIIEAQEQQAQDRASRQARGQFITEIASTVLMGFGALTGGILAGIGSAMGGSMIAIGTVVQGVDEMKDIFTTIFKSRHKTLDIKADVNKKIASYARHVASQQLIQALEFQKKKVSIFTQNQRHRPSPKEFTDLTYIAQSDLNRLSDWISRHGKGLATAAVTAVVGVIGFIFPAAAPILSAAPLTIGMVDNLKEENRYTIHDRDTLDAKLLKNILNLIHDEESAIAKIVREQSSYKFASNDPNSPSFYTFERDPNGFISKDNLKNLLGVGLNFVNKYIRGLNAVRSNLKFENTEPEVTYKNTILRLRKSLSNKFTSQFDNHLKSQFDNYIKKLDEKVQYLYRYLFLLVDHTNVDVSARVANNLLRNNDNRYLNRLILSDTTKSYDAFFGLIIETLTIADTMNIFMTDKDQSDFKSKFIDISFDYAKEVVFKNDFVPKEQFEFLAYSLYAYNKIGREEQVNPNNPGGLYLLSHLSRDFSETGNTQAIRQSLYQGRPTFQVFDITNDLRKELLRNREIVNFAFDKGKKYQEIIYSDWSSRKTTVGILGHKPLQILFHRLLDARGVEGLGIDTKVLSDRDYNPDTSMKWTKKLTDSIDLPLFKEIIKRNLRQVGSSLTVDDIIKRLRHLVLDYTLSMDKKVTIGSVDKPGKVRKHYHSPHRFFFIINIDENMRNPADPDNFNKYTSRHDTYIKNKMVNEYIENPEMVSYISFDEFLQIFKIQDTTKRKFRTNFNKIVKLINAAKRRRSSFNKLVDIYNSASNDYNKLKKSGVVFQFIGDLS